MKTKRMKKDEDKKDEESSKVEESTDNEDDTTICYDDEYGGFTFLQADILCSNDYKAAIPKSWILLPLVNPPLMYAPTRNYFKH